MYVDLVDLISPVADPEAMAKRGELRGHKGGWVWGGGCVPSQKKIDF